MMLSEIQINIFSELDRLIQRNHELLTPSGVIKELQKLRTHSTPKKRKKAEFALQFLKAYEIPIVNETVLPNETIDEYILRIAKKSNYIVATNDRDLRRRLRKKHVPVIYLRQRSHLSLNGFVG